MNILLYSRSKGTVGSQSLFGSQKGEDGMITRTDNGHDFSYKISNQIWVKCVWKVPFA